MVIIASATKLNIMTKSTFINVDNASNTRIQVIKCTEQEDLYFKVGTENEKLDSYEDLIEAVTELNLAAGVPALLESSRMTKCIKNCSGSELEVYHEK